jgi:hypothetical protein
VLASCSYDLDPKLADLDAGLAPDADADASATEEPTVGRVTLTVVERLELTQGQETRLRVHLTRHEGQATAVQVSAQELPEGVQAAPLSIPAEEVEGDLVLSSSTDATAGVLTSVQIRADTGETEARASVALFVRGKPGSLDESFGSDGIAAIRRKTTPGYAKPSELIVLDDDRLLVACTEEPTAAVVLRLRADGMLDTDFAIDGRFEVASELGESVTQTYAEGMMLTAAGRIRLVGEWSSASASGSYVLQLTGGGRPDPDFTPPSLDSLENLILRAVASDGEVPSRAIAVGTWFHNPLLLGLGYEGQPQGESVPTTYSPVGGFNFVFWDPFEERFIMGGGCDGKACLARTDKFGDRSTWGVADHQTFDGFGMSDGLVDAEGRYYAVGSGAAWLIVRYDPAPLTTSGKDEFQVHHDDVGPRSDWATALALVGQSLYVAGVVDDVEQGKLRARLGRYSLEGVRDTSFADDGLYAFMPAVHADSNVLLGVQSDGRLIVGMAAETGDLLFYRVWN